MLEMTMAENRSNTTFRPLGVTTSAAIENIATMLGQQIAVYTIKYQAAAAVKLNIPLGDVKALDLVMTFDAMATGHLAQLLGISAGGATALINRLEMANLVVRDRHPLDRRVIVIRPVMDRCKVLLAEREAMARELNALARHHDAGEMESIHTFLSDFTRTMKRETLVWLDSPSAMALED